MLNLCSLLGTCHFCDWEDPAYAGKDKVDVVWENKGGKTK
jgi:hypothetical protein